MANNKRYGWEVGNEPLRAADFTISRGLPGLFFFTQIVGHGSGVKQNERFVQKWPGILW